MKQERSSAVKKSKIPKQETFTLIIGELIVSLIVAAVFLLIGRFDVTVLLGVILGSAVTVFNFLFLSVSVNKVIDKYLEEDKLRTDGRTEEENQKFVNEHAMAIQNATTRSFMIRTVSMLAALVAAFLTELFNPIATVIPLLMLRPMLYVLELIKRKGEKTE